MREKIQGQGLDNVNVEPIRHWLKLGDQQMCNGWLNLEELIITLIPDFRFHTWLTRMSMEVIVTIVSKLVYKLFMGLTTYVYRGCSIGVVVNRGKKRHVGSFWPTLTKLKKTWWYSNLHKNRSIFLVAETRTMYDSLYLFNVYICMCIRISWICLRWLFTYKYHGKPPLHHHLGK